MDLSFLTKWLGAHEDISNCRFARVSRLQALLRSDAQYAPPAPESHAACPYRHAYKLQPDRTPRGVEQVLLVKVLARCTPSFPAGRFRYRSRANQPYLARRTIHVGGCRFHNPPAQCVTLRELGNAGLGNNDHSLGTERAVRRAENGDTPLAYPRYFADNRFDVVRMDTVAAALDQVLGSAREEDLAVDDVAHVAGIEPIATTEVRCRLGIPIVPTRRGRPLEFDATFGPLGHRDAIRVDDPELVRGERSPASNDLQRCG